MMCASENAGAAWKVPVDRSPAAHPAMRRACGRHSGGSLAGQRIDTVGAPLAEQLAGLGGDARAGRVIDDADAWVVAAVGRLGGGVALAGGGRLPLPGRPHPCARGRRPARPGAVCASPEFEGYAPAQGVPNLFDPSTGFPFPPPGILPNSGQALFLLL